MRQVVLPQGRFLGGVSTTVAEQERWGAHTPPYSALSEDRQMCVPGTRAFPEKQNYLLIYVELAKAINEKTTLQH